MTYENCYQILEEVRRGLKAYSSDYMQGTDTTGAYNNDDIVFKINAAQIYLFDLLVNRDPELFFKETDLTPSSGALTMPSDFYRIRRLEDADGLKINRRSLDHKRTSGRAGSKYRYYWQAGKIYVDYDSYSDVTTLFYVSRPRELTQGKTSAGGALSATLATTAKAIADYYNSVIIENITDSWVDTISAYSAVRVCTVAQTWAASKYYGTVSELPEALHPFIARKAIILMKQEPQSLEPPSQTEIGNFENDLNSKLQSLFGTFNTDQDIAELFQ
jgi:hypothetical protein